MHKWVGLKSSIKIYIKFLNFNVNFSFNVLKQY